MQPKIKPPGQLVLIGIKTALVVLFIFQLIKIQYAMLGADAGAILPASRDVVKLGLTPYIDLYTIYSPLSYYLLGILYLFAEIPNMQSVMYYNCLFVLLSGYLFWKFIPKHTHRDSIVLFYLLSLTPLLFDVKIETLALPLISILAIQSFKILSKNKPKQTDKNFFTSVILIGALFLFKQYYLILFPILVLLYIIGINQYHQSNIYIIKRLSLSVFLLTITVAIILGCILRFNFSNFILVDFIKQVSGKFLIDGCASFSDKHNPYEILLAYIRYLVLLYPYLSCLFVLALFAKTFTHKLYWYLILLIPSALFSFNINPQYLFIIAPYFFIVFTLLLHKKELITEYFSLSHIQSRFILIMLIGLSSFYILRNHVYSDILYLTNYDNIKMDYQHKEAEFMSLKSTLKPYEKVYLADINKINTYRLGLQSINAKKIGYIFLYGSCLDSAFNQYADKDARIFFVTDSKQKDPND